MPGTKIGGQRAAATNLKRYGKGFYSRIGKSGGEKTGVVKGFAANPELAQKAGKIGGARSSRLGIKNGQGVTRRKYENTSDNK